MGCVSSKEAAGNAVVNVDKAPAAAPVHEVNKQIQVQPSPKAVLNDTTKEIVPPIVNSTTPITLPSSQPASPKSKSQRLPPLQHPPVAANKPPDQPVTNEPDNVQSTHATASAVHVDVSKVSKRGTLKTNSRRVSSESKGLRSRAASTEGSVINYIPAQPSTNSSLNGTLTSDVKLKSTMPGAISSTAPSALERSPSFNTLLKTAHPSLLLSDPAYQTSRISETFLHYYKKKYELSSDRSAKSNRRATGGVDLQGDEERIDKKGLGQLATDSVLSFLHVVRETNTWKPEKWEKKEREERLRYLPGQSLSQAVDIAKLYWQQELQYKSGGVTKTMFFFHFARAYKAMFSYDGKLTIEREALVTKWNKIGPERLEEKAKAKQGKESARDNATEKSVSKTDRSARRSSGRSASKDLKPRKNRATAPANSISQLLASGGLNHESKLVQAEKKLSSHLSATASEAKNPVRPPSAASSRR